MSLTRPSVGDLLDRLSILRLKIHHGGIAGKPVGHFEEERQEILQRLPPQIDFLDPLVEHLFFVNEALWELTDAMRDAVDAKTADLQARYARVMLRMNDKRANLVGQIAAKYGDHRVEKIS